MQTVFDRELDSTGSSEQSGSFTEEHSERAVNTASDPAPATYVADGRHLLCTMRDCDPDILNDLERLKAMAESAAIATGATVLQVCAHQFAPQGVTALVVLAESHASLHTYPEVRVIFWDCFTCGDTCEPEKSIAVLEQALQPKSISISVIRRT